jgi:hypothetical protein
VPATLYEALSVPLAVTTRALSAADDLAADGDADGVADPDGAGDAGEGVGCAGGAAGGWLPPVRWCVTRWPGAILVTPVRTSVLAATAGGARSGVGAWWPGTRRPVLVFDAGT